MPLLQSTECLCCVLPYYAQLPPSGTLPKPCILNCSVDDEEVFKIAVSGYIGQGGGGWVLNTCNVEISMFPNDSGGCGDIYIR